MNGNLINRCLALCLVASLSGVLAQSCGASDIGDYLTKDGKLKEPLTIRYGNCLVAPMFWTIQPSGDWVTDEDLKGKLDARQLAALAQHLATQDFNTLPKTQGYQPPTPGLGCEYFVIAFGKKEAEFNI